MSDYIKRADAIKTLCLGQCDEEPKGCPARWCPMSNVLDAIPSADVLGELVPVPNRIDIYRRGAVVMDIRTYKKIERKRGEWIDSTDETWTPSIKCSNCGAKFHEVASDLIGKYGISVANDWNFCPNCGADMREREGE